DFASGQSGSDFGDPGALDLDLPEPAAQQGGSHGGANLSFDLPAPRGQSTRFGTAAAADHGALEIPANTPDLEALDLPVPAENLPIPAENLPIPAQNLPIPAQNLPTPVQNLPTPAADL